jgi:hypothetical protein
VQVWAIGCTLAEMATGCPLFPGNIIFVYIHRPVLVRRHMFNAMGVAKSTQALLKLAKPASID